jgi:hypothetical protein
MNKSPVYLPVLLAGLLATAGAYAQSVPAAGSSDLPPKAGEASTTVQGKPNADPNMPVAGKDSQKEAQRIMGAAPATAGTGTAEASAGKTRAEVIAELMGRRAALDAGRRSIGTDLR